MCGVATISRLLQIIGLFCKRALQKRLYSTKETYNFKEPNNHSHPMVSILIRESNALAHLPHSLHKPVIYVVSVLRH